MPQKKGRNNYKKKGNKNNKRNNASGNGNAARAGAGDAPSLQALRSIGDLSTFHNTADNGSAEATGGYYETYKAATTRFWEWMKQARPNSQMTRVNDLRKGANELLDSNIAFMDDQMKRGASGTTSMPVVVPANVLSDLSTSITYRERFTNASFGQDGGDEGHRYMIEVLRFCRSVLKFGRNVVRVSSRNDKVSTTDDPVDAIGGRFNALVLDEAEEESEDDLDEVESDIRARNFPVYSGPEVEEEIDIEAVLINGDDRFEAIILLHTVDELMGVIDQHYGLLKNHLRGRGGVHGATGTACIQLMMECAAAVNFATNSILSAENALMTRHPHISSFYDILALVVHTELVSEVRKAMSPNKVASEPHGALNFVGDIIECSFHNKGGERLGRIVKQHSKLLGIPSSILETRANQVHHLTSLECQLAMEEAMNPQMNGEMVRMGWGSHMWFKHYAYIGGDRCIINTQVIVQKVMGMLQNKTKLVGRPGFWGEHFDENRSNVSRIRGELDDPFASAILPELIEIARYAPFECLPETEQLITVLDLLQKHVKGERTKPVPLALTFGLHAILTSIFVLQGDQDLSRLASCAKKSYNTLFRQLDEVSIATSAPQNNPIFYKNVNTFKSLAIFSKPVVIKLDGRVAVDTDYSEKMAFWNPVIGGEYMLYATFVGSVGLGSVTVDSMGQLRFALHLYNALKQRNQALQIPFLANLDSVFSTTKAVWVGGKPMKGTYCKHFWLAWGMSLADATRNAANRIGDEKEFPLALIDNSRRTPNNRKLDELLPGEFSKAYKRLVQQDFADEEGQARYTVRNDSKELKRERGDVVDTLTRINATRDAMLDDKTNVIPVNFTKVGCILLAYVNEISAKMGWIEVVDQIMAAHPEARTGVTVGGTPMRGFTASDLNCRHQGLAHCWAQMMSQLDVRDSNVQRGGLFDADKLANLTVEYFQSITKEQFTFLVEEKAEQSIKLTKPNPLEASYPYGQTGRTQRDPLGSHYHFRLSKRGTHTARLIIPGKLAIQGGDVPPVYQGPSKVIPTANGKFRHIADYTLEELIDLGWDGSFYMASKGRHEVKGKSVPFIPGYDSDSGDEYECIDVERGRRAGTIGLSPDQVGLYMTVPNRDGSGENLVQLQ